VSPIAPTPDAQRRTQAMERLSRLLRMLSTVINDRQPDSQKQTPETEWRRQRDLVVSLNTVRDVLTELIRLVQDGGLAQLVVKGQLLTSTGDRELPLDPPMGVTKANVAILTVQNGNLKWDPNFYAQALDCCGGGGIGHMDYGLITDPPTLFDDYEFVADPPLSSYDWGDLEP
jgi:hypothetical protein